uniref:TIL domain-containing protein n=1 Tax=Ciona savignyi TaxID=51511 RepID=H2Z4J7_CIOSA
MGDNCVPLSQCPTTVPPTTICPGNQEFSMCGGCNVQCSDKDSPPPCPLRCHVGCFCPANTYLSGDNCVSYESCNVA